MWTLEHILAWWELFKTTETISTVFHPSLEGTNFEEQQAHNVWTVSYCGQFDADWLVNWLTEGYQIIKVVALLINRHHKLFILEICV